MLGLMSVAKWLYIVEDREKELLESIMFDERTTSQEILRVKVGNRVGVTEGISVGDSGLVVGFTVGCTSLSFTLMSLKLLTLVLTALLSLLLTLLSLSPSGNGRRGILFRIPNYNE